MTLERVLSFKASKPRQIVAVLSLLALGWGLEYAWRLIATGVSFKAKVLCSGVFVSHRLPEAVLREDLEVEDLAPLRLIDTRVDWQTRQTEAHFLGMIRQKAAYRPGYGCSLVFNDRQRLTAHQASDPAPVYPPPVADIGDNPEPDSKLQDALDWAFDEPDPAHLRRTRAVVILHRGKLAAERYTADMGPETALAGWSLAKSVTNALVGVAVEQGKLDIAAEAPVPEWRGVGDPRGKITLDQLLHMESGLRFSENAGEALGDVTQMLLRAPNAAAYAAAQALASPPGSTWHYASGNTNLLSRILRDRLGEEAYRNWPRQALFAPLGMNSAVLETDADGNFVGSSFMYATARDWAKLGQLYLQDGIWGKHRLLPAGWVRYSTTPSPKTPDRQYGAHFWLNIQAEYGPDDPEPRLPQDAFHAVGHEGQCVSIIPSKQLVVVRLGLTRTASSWRQDRFLNQILRAIP